MANNIVNFTKDSQEEYKIRRKKDYEKTCRVNNLVDDVLNEAGVPFIRNNTHVELQKQGVDLVIFRNGKPVSVDEKYATSCWNRPLNTFSFELASRNNTNNAGWFSSSSLFTQDYMLVWLRASEETLRDVFYLDIMFVEKETIRKYLCV